MKKRKAPFKLCYLIGVFEEIRLRISLPTPHTYRMYPYQRYINIYRW